MKSKKLHIWNQRVLQFIDFAVSDGRCRTQREFLESIDFRPENISQVKNGKQGFTVEHLRNIAKTYGANVNWIIGLETDMMRRPAKSPLQQIKEAVKALETQ